MSKREIPKSFQKLQEKWKNGDFFNKPVFDKIDLVFFFCVNKQLIIVNVLNFHQMFILLFSRNHTNLKYIDWNIIRGYLIFLKYIIVFYKYNEIFKCNLFGKN